jgi:hypothetical protein
MANPWERTYAEPSAAPGPWARNYTAPAATPVDPAEEERKRVLAQQAKEYETDTWGNMAARAGSAIVNGPADLIGGAWNYGPTRYLINKGAELLGYGDEAVGKLPSAASAVNEAIGVPEIPSYASDARRFAEGAIPAVATAGVGAGVQALRVGAPILASAARSVLPSLTAVTGSTVGGKIGETVAPMIGASPEGGAFYGSLGGGVLPSAVRAVNPMVSPTIDRTMAKPNAAQIAADARSLGITPTPTMLGTPFVAAQERQLSGLPGSAQRVQGMRDTLSQQVRDAGQNIVEQRQALPPTTPGNAPVIQLAEQTRAAGGDVRGVLQNDLMTRTGPRAPMDAGGIITELVRQAQRSDPTTAAPLIARARALNQMIRENRANYDADGRLVGTEIPYERGKSWRSNLSASDTNISAVPFHLRTPVRDAATEAMRQTATRSGVPREQFDTTQRISANQYGAEQIGQRLQRTLGEQGATSYKQFAQWWERLPPQERVRLGADQEAQLAALARVSREANIPTSQTGLTQSIGGQMQQGIGRAIKAGLGTTIGGAIGSMIGSPFVGGPIGGFVGGALADQAYPMLNAARFRRHQRSARELALGPLPPGTMRPADVARLLAILEAAGIGARR